MLPTFVLCSAVGIGLVVGVLIGSVGVGGIVIVPTLIELPGISVQTAIAVRFHSTHSTHPDPPGHCPKHVHTCARTCRHTLAALFGSWIDGLGVRLCRWMGVSSFTERGKSTQWNQLLTRAIVATILLASVPALSLSEDPI